MDSFERYLGDTFELVELLKTSEQGFIAVVYDKYAKRLCTMKERSLKSREIYQTLKDMASPHIPEIYRLFERDGKLIVVEEHIDGQTLEEILIYEAATFNEDLAVDILKQICNCLAPLHELKIIHRDIKPANVMLDKNRVVKLIDFGIARIMKSDSYADTEILGTVGYASPEQSGLFNYGQTDPRSDIYSLGITIKQLLGEGYSGWLLKILNRCTDLNPARRFQNIAELLNAVDRTHKFRVLKKICAGIFIIAAVIVFPTLTDFSTETPAAEIKNDEPVIENPAPKIQETPVAESKSDLNSALTDQLVAFTKEPPAVIETPAPIDIPKLNISPTIPKPSAQVETPTVETLAQTETPKKRDPYKEISLLYYLNGKLTKEQFLALDVPDLQSWPRNEYQDYLFPAGWDSVLRIENHGNKDLVNPHITIEFDHYSYSVDKPTIKPGQSTELNISLQNQVAAHPKGDGRIHIVIESQTDDYPTFYLNRRFHIDH